MSLEGKDLAAVIGGRVREGRVSLGWTLDALAERSGVSRRMVVKVEQGETNPSVTTLLLLSSALGIGLPALVADDPVPSGTGPRLVPAGAGAVLWSSPGGGAGVLLAGTSGPDVLELWSWTLAPGDVHDSSPHGPGTQEVLHVTAGTVELDVEDETFSLAPGDTVSFPGDRRHAYRAASPEPATFALTVFEPATGSTVERTTP